VVKLDDSFLQEMGLAELAEEERTSLLQYLRQALGKRVGAILAKDMDLGQLKEFERLLQQGEKHAIGWLKEHCPNYAAVVEEEFGKLKQELIDNKQAILVDED
jgi:hypothetical protein